MRSMLQLLLAGCLLLPLFPRTSAAQQQTGMRPMYELPTITVTAVAETDPLYERATALYEQARWKDAAVLHREAAESMPKNDPNAYLQYDRSARLYFYAGDYTTSRQMMERAAQIAEATGPKQGLVRRRVQGEDVGKPRHLEQTLRVPVPHHEMRGL